MKKLQRLWARLKRNLRRRIDDRRSGSRVCFGGPLDGQRLSTIHGHQRRYWLCMSGLVYMRYIPMYCEGEYTLTRDRFMWEQWAEVEVLPPPPYRSDTEPWL